MRNPAKYTTELKFFLRKKGWRSGFTLSNKAGFVCDPVGNVFCFFCDQNRSFFRGDGGSLPGPHLLRLAGPGKVLMIAIRKLLGDLGEL